MTTTKEISIYTSAFENIITQQSLPSEVLLKKQEAIHYFEHLGLPSMKHEEWKYTYLAKILKKGFTPFTAESTSISNELIAAKLPVKTDKNRVVFIDGIFSNEFSDVQTSALFKIQSLSTAWTNQDETVKNLFGTLTENKKQALTQLNTALSQDGLVIEVAEEATAHVEIIYVHTGSLNISQPRVLIHVAEHAYLNIAEQHILLGDQTFSNKVSEVFLKSDSKVEWVKIQDAGAGAYQMDSTYATQDSRSQFHCTTISLTGKLLRNNHFIQINGEEAHADLGGAYILDHEQQADHLIVIEHAAPNATSNQLYKGILDGKSTGVFNGKIVVVEDAQKTNAFQSNKNILLSDDAAAFFRPQLEIFADDVKCSHGATSAQIEDHELFYLRSRGISKELSKSLLMFAFVGDVIEDIQDEQLKNWVHTRVASKLKIDL